MYRLHCSILIYIYVHVRTCTHMYIASVCLIIQSPFAAFPFSPLLFPLSLSPFLPHFLPFSLPPFLLPSFPPSLPQVVVMQAYKNNSPVAIEAKYVFPLDDMAAVCGFEAFINGKHIVGQVHTCTHAHTHTHAYMHVHIHMYHI